jgi:hypothetical protein
MDHETERPLVAESQERLSMIPDGLLHRLLHLIERRDDLVDTTHHLTSEQRAAVKVFESIGAAMAVREFVPPRKRVERDPTGYVLLVEVPETAMRAHVYSTAGFTTLDGKSEVRNYDGNMPLPGNLLGHRIHRVEFYDARGDLIAIAGAEAPAGQP